LELFGRMTDLWYFLFCEKEGRSALWDPFVFSYGVKRVRTGLLTWSMVNLQAIVMIEIVTRDLPKRIRQSK
jgi:hypothetical protein